MQLNKAKSVYGSQGKQIYCLFPISRQCPATSWEAVALEDKCHNKCPFSLPLPLLFFGICGCAGVIWYGISLWIVWVSCPDCVLSQDLAHPQPHWWEGNVGDTAVMLSQQTPMCYQLFSSYHFRGQHWGLLWGKLTSPQPDPQAQKAYKLGEEAIETASRLFRTSRQTVCKKVSNSCYIHRPISTGIPCQLLGAITLL